MDPEDFYYDHAQERSQTLHLFQYEGAGSGSSTPSDPGRGNAASKCRLLRGALKWFPCTMSRRSWPNRADNARVHHLLINKFMRSREFISERVINLKTAQEKSSYADQVWDMLRRSYEKIGGFQGASGPEELATEPGLWKLVRRGNRITALGIYKQVPRTLNFKMIASASETERDPETGEVRATVQGRHDYNMIKNSDIKTRRSWAEVSGAAEKIMLRSGALPISNRYAAALTNKQILDLDSDGFHYTRLIQGEPKTKVIVGFVNLSDLGVHALKNQGISVEELPPNISVGR